MHLLKAKKLIILNASKIDIESVLDFCAKAKNSEDEGGHGN
jgi:hypothetical protein